MRPRRLIGLLLLCASCGGGGSDAVLTQLSEARSESAELRVLLHKAAEAEKRAVMAETDEASAENAKEAREATGQIDGKLKLLTPSLAKLGYAPEQKLLAEFEKSFAESRTLDQEILGLAVENTNLKAQRLSFGAMREAAEALGRALDAAVAAAPTGSRDKARLAAQATLLSVREIQWLEGPHIAEHEDAAMTDLEQKMKAAQSSAEQSLGELESVAGAAAKPALADARATLTRIVTTNQEIVALSRKNTNVRSLVLSLGQKRKLTAACEEALSALSAALDARGFRATR